MKDYAKVGSKPGKPSYRSPSRLLAKSAYSKAGVKAKKAGDHQDLPGSKIKGKNA